MKKVELRKKVGTSVFTILPKTSADIVKYSDMQSVQDVLEAILEDIKLIKRFVGIPDNLYARDDAGKLLDDGKGTNLVMVSKNTDTEVYDRDKTTGKLLDDGSGMNITLLKSDFRTASLL